MQPVQDETVSTPALVSDAPAPSEIVLPDAPMTGPPEPSVIDVAVATPIFGEVSVGLALNTSDPVPVTEVMMDASCVGVVDAN